MKKIGIFLACLGICAGSAFPQTPSLAPKDARSMGMGGVFSAISSGYVSFYGNPAGFSQAGNLTLLDTATWVYFDPSPANLSKLQSML
ncbi:MAG: hypothetical protein Q8O19_05865, partial [Rectinemataceae bacterium]|nr:hypothetical protein [Rectinemataceae bacterium]